MSFYEIILLLSAVGAIIGGIDHLLGNRFRLGQHFIEGFNIMATLAISSAGIIVLAPVLVQYLQPVLLPVFRFLKADPAMFAAVTGYGDHAINYVVRVWCPTDKYWDVFNATTYNIKVIFDREGIEMTYPHLNVHLEK